MPRVKRTQVEQDLADARGTDYVEALARGLKVLQAFDHVNTRLTLSEVARSVELPRATVRRNLFTLCALGFVERDEKLFWLTPNVLKFATAYLTSNGLSEVLQSSCDKVAELLDQGCSAAVLKDQDVVFIARAKHDRILTVGLDVGYRLPCYCTSVGRTIMSGMEDVELDRMLGELRPVALTAQTLTDPEQIKSEILVAHAQGYCIVDQEAEQGFRSIAVPVRRHCGKIVAALNIGAHSEAVSIGRMIDEFLPVMREAAKCAGKLVQ